jgi:hypothetical protein
MKPLIAYIRVSTAKQGTSGLGLEAQQDAINRFAVINGYDVLQTFIEVDCPHKVGDIFTTNGREYRVQKVSPGGKGRTVYLHCHYRTSAKQWSQGTKLVSHEV